MLPITNFVSGIVSIVFAGIALLITGSIVGILSGVSPIKPAIRQLFMGYGAAIITVIF